MALIMVLAVIFALGIIAGGFAYSMKVEVRLAQNHNNETELEWLGRSGVELARYVLSQQKTIPGEPYDALNQKWAGGTGVTNEALADITLENNELGMGVFSIKIVDLERKANINAADQMILQNAMNLLGMDTTDAQGIVNSVLDWRDTDDDPHINGTESDYYLTLKPPYYAKNGPLDDIAELLLIRGVTPELYWGPKGGANTTQGVNPANAVMPKRLGQRQQPQYTVGLVDLFTTLSERQVNINTAPAAVMQLFPGIDSNVAQGIIQLRAGPDGVEGNDDDTPLRNAGDLVNVPGIGRGIVGQVSRYFATVSLTFEVHVEARIGNYRREYVSVLRRTRNNPREIQTLFFYWK
jgi:general secretion pathway protein K